ncbi:MAG: flagellar assembly protein FliX [Rhodospirillales bacterium]|nr:flagellar assembly protein FliX [Rhodospirillales bacterium]
MKVGETGGPRSVGGTRGTGRAGGAKGTDFAKLLEDAGKEPDAVGGAAPAHAVGGILGAQEVEDSTNGRANSRARQRADEMLDRLEELRRGLMAGTMSRQSLQELAQLVRARPEAGADPHMREILGEIELRAAVELAKLDISR